MSRTPHPPWARPPALAAVAATALASLAPVGALAWADHVAQRTTAAGNAAAATPDAGVAALHRTAATAGFLAYALMVGTVAWGILTTTHLARRGIRRQTLYGGHQTMATMTLSFAAIHIAGNLYNPRAGLGLVHALVPFLPGSTVGIGLGVISIELAVAIAISIWFQQRLGYRTWHAIHWLAYPSFGLAFAHTVVSGSDVHAELAETALLASLTAVAALFVLRALPATSLVRSRVAPAEH